MKKSIIASVCLILETTDVISIKFRIEGQSGEFNLYPHTLNVTPLSVQTTDTDVAHRG
jgi:hypothetical protein